MVAKVLDFGLSKKLPLLDDTHASTGVKGSFGYFDPEYYERRQVIPKSDVYSFGVVLLEALCGRLALEMSVPNEESNLAQWAKYCHKKGKLEDIMDPNVKGEIYPNCYRTFVETTMKCLNKTSIGRSSMGDVLYELELALAIQKDPEESPTYVMTNLGGHNIFSDVSGYS
ncbi:receptor-like protein kinase FERONIA [Silene latifolia]|uniref:receptor-like protein kinase FERONIA n=1 Tax=Silene latifolia TaxID=37657 RepID=UPI003D780778